MDNNLSLNSKKFALPQKTFTRLLAFFICMLLTSSVFATSASANSNFKQLIVDGLVCRGNNSTQCSFITKKYYQDVGDVVDPDEIADARLRLGTLQQFKNVSIVLEKASQRGRVNVVFIVNEANNIQYSLGGDYSYFDTSSAGFNYFGLNAGVTNFNFLGTGKQLSFDVSSNYLNSSYSFLSNDITSKGSSLRLKYYDPHLLGSVNYYFNAGITLSRSSQERLLFAQTDNTSTLNIDSDFYSYNLSLGRRFASHSYVAVYALGAKNKSNAIDAFNQADTLLSPVFGAEYGWDSRDDLIFPTEGSSFSVQVDDSIFESNSTITTVTDTNGNTFTTEIENQKSVFFSYSDNIALNSNLIFNYGIRGNIDLATLDEFDRQPFQTVSLGLTSIDSTHGADGDYKGWKYGVSLPINPDGLKIESAGLSLSYIYQTDALIVNLSLGYQFDFKEVF